MSNHIQKIILSFLFCFNISSFAQAFPSSNELEVAYKNNPGDNNLYFQYGIALSHENKDSEAIAVFNKLLVTYPQSSSIYNNLAVIYARQKNFDKTEDLLKNAIKFSPNYDTAYENMADLYAKLSVLNYQKAYEINKNTSLVSKIDNLNKVLDVPVGAFPVSNKVEQSSKSDNKPIETKVSLPVALPSYSKTESTLAQNDNISSSDKLEINQFLQQWQHSWENKDIQTYLAFYDSSFIASNMTYEQWVQQRTKNINSQQNIHITLSNININLISNNVHVTFSQTYKSKNVNSVDRVDYVVQKINNQWKFVRKM